MIVLPVDYDYGRCKMYAFNETLSSRRLSCCSIFLVSHMTNKSILASYWQHGIKSKRLFSLRLRSIKNKYVKEKYLRRLYTHGFFQSEWLSITYEKLLNLLRSTMERGELYVDLVLTLLRHERNWVGMRWCWYMARCFDHKPQIIWKSAGCPPFEKPHADITSLNQAINTKRRKLNVRQRILIPFYPDGSAKWGA